jgi:hypothetical protein
MNLMEGERRRYVSNVVVLIPANGVVSMTLPDTRVVKDECMVVQERMNGWLSTVDFAGA